MAYMRCQVGCFSRVRMGSGGNLELGVSRVMGFQRFEVKDFGGVRIWGLRGFCKYLRGAKFGNLKILDVEFG